MEEACRAVERRQLFCSVVEDTVMNTVSRNGFEAGSWKELYHAAICEADLKKLPERIAAAEAALVLRSRELFYAAGDDADEGESLDYAMYILHALDSSLRRRKPGVDSSAA